MPEPDQEFAQVSTPDLNYQPGPEPDYSPVPAHEPGPGASGRSDPIADTPRAPEPNYQPGPQPDYTPAPAYQPGPSDPFAATAPAASAPEPNYPASEPGPSDPFADAGPAGAALPEPNYQPGPQPDYTPAPAYQPGPSDPFAATAPAASAPEPNYQPGPQPDHTPAPTYVPHPSDLFPDGRASSESSSQAAPAGALMLDVAARTDPPTAEQQERIDAASKGNIELGLPTKEELNEAQSRFREGTATAEDTRTFVREAVGESRGYLSVTREYSLSSESHGPPEHRDLTATNLEGSCGQGRDLAAWSLVSRLQDSQMPVSVERYSVADLTGTIESQAHEYAVVRFELAEGTVSYLLVPTESQFDNRLSRDPNWQGDQNARSNTGQVRETYGGAETIAHAYEHGWVPLNEATAYHILDAALPANTPNREQLLETGVGNLLEGRLAGGSSVRFGPGTDSLAEQWDRQGNHSLDEEEVNRKPNELREAAVELRANGRQETARDLDLAAGRLEETRAGLPPIVDSPVDAHAERLGPEEVRAAEQRAEERAAEALRVEERGAVAEERAARPEETTSTKGAASGRDAPATESLSGPAALGQRVEIAEKRKAGVEGAAIAANAWLHGQSEQQLQQSIEKGLAEKQADVEVRRSLGEYVVVRAYVNERADPNPLTEVVHVYDAGDRRWLHGDLVVTSGRTLPEALNPPNAPDKIDPDTGERLHVNPLGDDRRLVPHEVARYAPYQAESPVLGSYGDADHPGAALTIYSEGVLTGTPSVSMQLEGMSDPLQSSRTELDPSGTRLVATFDQAPGYRLEIVQTDSGVGSTLRSPGGFDETRRWVKE